MSNVFKLYGEIGGYNPFTGATGITVADVDAFISNSSKYDSLTIEIDSYGGNVDEAFAIYDKLKATGKKIETIGYRVASAATIVFLAGDKRSIARNALFNVHFPFIEQLEGKLTSNELKKIAAEIEAYDKRVLKFYKRILNLNEEQIEALIDIMKADKDIGASGALRFGFATHILERNPIAFCDSLVHMFYSNNQKMKAKMKTKKQSFIAKVKALLADVKASSVELNDGTLLYFDSETIEVGTAVFLDEDLSNPAPDGEYTLADGTVITVVNGVVETITESALPASDVEEAIALLAEEIKKLKQLYGGKIVAKKSVFDKNKTHASSVNTEFLKRIKNELNR